MSELVDGYPRDRSFRGTRALSWGLIGIVGAMMIGAPMASGGNVLPLIRGVSPPYTGTTLLVTSSGVGNATGGCAQGTMPVPPSFNASSGAFAIAIGAAARSCGNTSFTFHGDTVNTQGIITIPFGVARNGTFNISMHVALTLHLNWNLHFGHCTRIPGPANSPGCTQVVWYGFGLLGRLGDATTGWLVGSTVNTWTATNYTQNSTSCSGVVCTSTVDGEPATGSTTTTVHLTLYLTAALSRSDTYQMEIYVSGGVQSEFYANHAYLSGGIGTMASSLTGLIRSITLA